MVGALERPGLAGPLARVFDRPASLCRGLVRLAAARLTADGTCMGLASGEALHEHHKQCEFAFHTHPISSHLQGDTARDGYNHTHTLLTESM
jgi:hypothetical protein